MILHRNMSTCPAWYFCALIILMLQPAQAALAPGDLYVVGFNADGSKDFAFVVLTNVPGGETIFFTDKAVSNNVLRPGETVMTYTAPPEGLAAGAVVTITNAGTGTSRGTVTRDSVFTFSASGDQLTAFQLASVGTNFLFTLNTEGTDWTVGCEVPPGLRDGWTALHTAKHLASNANIDNGRFATQLVGTAAELRSAIGTAPFWAFSEDAAFEMTFADAEILRPPIRLAFQGFEGTAEDTWAIEQAQGAITNNPGALDKAPKDARIRSGAYSYQTENATATLILSPVSCHHYRDVTVTLYISATASNSASADGPDSNDYVAVYAAVNDQSLPSEPDIRVWGGGAASSGGARWRFSEVTARTTLGASVAYGPAGGGRRDAQGDGWAKLQIVLPNGSQSVRLKIVTKCDANDWWNVDDIELTGRPPQASVMFFVR